MWPYNAAAQLQAQYGNGTPLPQIPQPMMQGYPQAGYNQQYMYTNTVQQQPYTYPVQQQAYAYLPQQQQQQQPQQQQYPYPTQQPYYQQVQQYAYQQQQYGYQQQQQQQQMYQQYGYQPTPYPAQPILQPPPPPPSGLPFVGDDITDKPIKLLEPIKININVLFKKPECDNRPAKIVIILRGLPGSGKTHVAKILKELEVQRGGNPPRIATVDDYFRTDVDKEEIDPETGEKRKITVSEYKYEKELEPAYNASVLKAFKRWLSEGFFPFLIVDNVNVHVSDFEPYCVAAKAAGYEVYILQLNGDHQECAQRNVHSRTLEEIEKMAAEWEATPYKYNLLDPDSVVPNDKADEPPPPPSAPPPFIPPTPDEEAQSTSTENTEKSSKWEAVEAASSSKPKEKRKRSSMKQPATEDDKKNTQQIQGLLGKTYYAKKVRWADIETEKALEKGEAVNLKKKQYAFDSDSDEDSQPAPKKSKNAFLDRVKEEQRQFKIKLKARKALERVQGEENNEEEKEAV